MQKFLRPAAAVALGLLIGALIMALTGHNVIEGYAELLRGAFGNPANLGATLSRSGTIALAGLGVAVAFRAGALNIGGEGQLAWGGLVAALAALTLPLPGPLLIPASLLAGALAGGLWALLAGWFQTQFKVQVLISSLLLNYIGVKLISYLVTYPLRDRSGISALSQTPVIPEAARLTPLISGTRLHLGLLLIPVIAGLIWYLLMHTKRGYEWRMSGLNPFFAKYGGISATRNLLTALLTSGALAGLAGAMEVLAQHHRYIDGNLTRPQFAWSGIMAALLANNHPVGTVAAALLLGALQVGAAGLERNTDVPLEISAVIQAVIVLFVTARLSFNWWQRRRKGETQHG